MHTRRTRCIARTPTRRPAESSGLEKNDKVTTVPTLKSPPQYHEQYEGWAQALPSSQHSRTFDTVVLYGHHSYTLEKGIAQNIDIPHPTSDIALFSIILKYRCIMW